MTTPGVTARKRRVTYRRGWTAKPWLSLTARQQKRLLEHLMSDRPLRPPPSVWGAGGRPDTCIDCRTTEIPHAAKGLCRRCYSKARKKAARDQ